VSRIAHNSPASCLVSTKLGWIDRSWPEIKRWAHHLLYLAGEAPDDDPRPLDRVNPHRGRLGAGMWGITFQVTDRVVLKITLDESEAVLWQGIWAHEKLRYHPGITLLLSQGYVPTEYIDIPVGTQLMTSGQHLVYTVLREDVRPMGEFGGVLSPNGEERLASKLHDVRELAHTAIKKWTRGERSRELEAYLASVRHLAAGKPVKAIAPVGDFMHHAFGMLQTIMEDVHGSNVGWATHDMRTSLDGFHHRPVKAPNRRQLKIFDPGMSSMPASMARAYLETIPPNPGNPPGRRRDGACSCCR